MKDYHIPIILIISILITSLFIIGCATYNEGDSVAALSFQKMTVQEKTIYDAVEKEWYQDKLEAIRTAVGKRDIAPRENSVPFIDIANVIKTNNDVTLKMENGWNTEHKNRAIKCRWDRLDEDWYRKLLLTIGVTDYKLQDLMTTKEKDLQYISDGLKEINTYIDENPEVIKKNISLNNVLSFNDYDDLYYEIKNCPEAIIAYNNIIEEKVLDNNDKKQLITIALECKAQEIKTKLEKFHKE